MAARAGPRAVRLHRHRWVLLRIDPHDDLTDLYLRCRRCPRLGRRQLLGRWSVHDLARAIPASWWPEVRSGD